MTSRAALFQQLNTTTPYDLAIIGGGATGLGARVGRQRIGALFALHNKAMFEY